MTTTQEATAYIRVNLMDGSRPYLKRNHLIVDTKGEYCLLGGEHFTKSKAHAAKVSPAVAERVHSYINGRLAAGYANHIDFAG